MYTRGVSVRAMGGWAEDGRAKIDKMNSLKPFTNLTIDRQSETHGQA